MLNTKILTFHPRVKKQVFSYKLNNFASDIGGLSGLFLGFSIWGTFTTIKHYAKVLMPRRFKMNATTLI